MTTDCWILGCRPGFGQEFPPPLPLIIYIIIRQILRVPATISVVPTGTPVLNLAHPALTLRCARGQAVLGSIILPLSGLRFSEFAGIREIRGRVLVAAPLRCG